MSQISSHCATPQALHLARPSLSRQLLAEFAGTEIPPASFVFSHEVDGHTPWRPDYATLAFVRLRDELGLGEVRLHDLRHFVATADRLGSILDQSSS